jgi:sulfite oxidase
VARDAEGWNAGPVPELLALQVLTPAALLYIRSHAPTPAVDPATWRLRVGGLVRRPLELTLEDLRSDFPRHDLTATLVCAGLRRTELFAVRPVPGELPWGVEAVGTGWWAGVALADVLAAAGVGDGAAHVEFTGLDAVQRDGDQFGFGGSIPLEKALSQEVLLAFELNGAPLPPEHGFPVRVVVPGYYGARSVKWLGEIRVRREPSANYFQVKAYRVQREPDPADPRDVRGGTPLGELSLNSAILWPGPDTPVPAGQVTVKGWAYSGAERPVARVEVSGDAGHHWVEAELSGEGPWAWRLWRTVLTLSPGRHTLVVRAFDAAGRGQPEHLTEVWNVKGYGNNAWHRVSLSAGIVAQPPGVR